MLDASNPDPAPKAKKIKSQHRPTQRFWPNSIAAGVLQQQGGTPGTNPDGKCGAECDPLRMGRNPQSWLWKIQELTILLT